MTSKTSLYILATAVGVAAIAAVVWSLGKHDERITTSPGAETAPLPLAIKSQSQATLATASSSGTTITDKDSAARAPEIAKQFQEAADYRVLYESLLRAKTDRSGLYALHILTLCNSMRTVDFKAKPSTSSQQDQAQQKMTARCSTFTADELSGTKRLEALKDPRTQGRLRELRAAWSGSLTDPNKRSLLLGEVFAANDPLLLQYVGPAVFYTLGGKAIRFQGRTYEQPYAVDVLAAAWRAAGCEATQTQCGSGDPLVLENCATNGVCLDSLQTLMRQSVKERHGQEGAAMYASVYPELVTAIRTGNTSAFAW